MNRVFGVYFLLGAGLTVSPAAVAKQLETSKPDSGVKPVATAHAEVPFDLYRGQLIVAEGSLGPLKKQKFLIDTGASPSVVDQRAAKKLRLVKKPGKLALLNENVPVERAVLPRIEVGTDRAESLPVLVRDLSFLEKSLDVKIDAVIGFDVLAQDNLSIDYGRKRLLLGPVGPAPNSVPFETGPPFVTVRMQVQERPVRLLIDTGASSLMLFESRLYDRLGQLPIQGLAKLDNMGGQFQRKRVILQGLSLGGTSFGSQVAFLVEDQRDSGRQFDGLLSIGALGLKQIMFDFQRGVFQWVR